MWNGRTAGIMARACSTAVCASAKEGTLNISSPLPNSDAWVTIRLKPVDSSKIFKTLLSNISIEIYNRDQKSE